MFIRIVTGLNCLNREISISSSRSFQRRIVSSFRILEYIRTYVLQNYVRREKSIEIASKVSRRERVIPRRSQTLSGFRCFRILCKRLDLFDGLTDRCSSMVTGKVYKSNDS